MNSQTDQTKLKRLQNSIRARKGLIGCGEEFSMALHHAGRLLYAGTDRWGQEDARDWSEVIFVACGQDHVAALTSDGTVRMAGRASVDPAFAEGQSCVRSIAVGKQNLAVLLGNGLTIVGGNNRYGQCNTHEWPSVTDVICGKRFTVGLTPSGQTVISGGSRALRYTVRAWKSVAGIFSDYEGTAVYGITADGKLLSSSHLPRRVQKWKNLVYVSAARDHIWAVTATGQLLSTDPAVERISKNKQYIACAVSPTHAVALSRDGQVISAGKNDFGQCSTARFGALFADFDEFSADRRAHYTYMDESDHAYQAHLIVAVRNKRFLACGERITACICADGRVLSSSGFHKSKQWSQVRALACGNAHLLALHENGHVSADGNNVDGCVEVNAWRKIKSIAAGKYHSIGLCEDGTVLFCGRNDMGQGDVTEWTGVRHIYTSDDYTVGVTYDGKLLLAGTPPFDATVISDSWQNPCHVILTDTHMVCLYADGRVYDTFGMTSEISDMRTERWNHVRAIAACHGITVGLCYGGRVLTASEQAIGLLDTTSWKHVVDVGCGEGYVIGLCSNGRILSVGCFADGQEVDVDHWRDVIALQCGPGHLAGLTRSGQVLACGADDDKQCSATAHFSLFRDVRQLYGYGQYSRQIEMEIRANRIVEETLEIRRKKEAFTDFAEASAALRGSFAVGMAHTVYLDEVGRIRAEGANDCGQCDLGVVDAVKQVAAGPYRSAAILSDGRIFLAGRNSDGQGDARILNRELNGVDATAAYVWNQISCGHTHTVALRSDGRVYAIGANPDGRCDTRQWRDVAEITCGIRHTVARRSDGTCMAVGDNRYGQCGVTEWRNVTMIAAGEYHTIALTADGCVLAVGDHRKGQCAVDDLRDVVSIACLPEATLCVLRNGRVVIRGGSGELNAAVESLRDVVALDTCEYRIAAMTANRELLLIP